MKKKLSILFLAAMFVTVIGTGNVMAMEPNDNMENFAKGRDNMKPPTILPPQV